MSQFLVDAHPSHLVKTSSEPGGALQRARINFFVDTYFSKANGLFFGILRTSGQEAEDAATLFTDAIVKEVEPLLADAAPFFGGSSRLTLAEVDTPYMKPKLQIVNGNRFKQHHSSSACSPSRNTMDCSQLAF